MEKASPCSAGQAGNRTDRVWALCFGALLCIIAAGLVFAAAPLPVGEIVFVSDVGGNYDIYTIDAGGGTSYLLIGGLESDRWPCLSHDRKQIAFTRRTTAPSEEWKGDIHVYDRASGTVTVLTSDGDAHKPVWSPDRTQIAFDAFTGGLQVIDVMTGERETVVANRFADRPSWLPDGLRIAYCISNHSVPGTVTSDGIFIVDVATHASTMVVDFGFSPVVSPDGERIAFSSDLEGNSDIFVVSIEGSGLVNLTSDSVANEWSPMWSPNGRHIAFVTDRDGNYEIYRMDADGANPVNLTNLPESDESEPDWR